MVFTGSLFASITFAMSIQMASSMPRTVRSGGWWVGLPTFVGSTTKSSDEAACRLPVIDKQAAAYLIRVLGLLRCVQLDSLPAGVSRWLGVLPCWFFLACHPSYGSWGRNLPTRERSR